MQVHAGQRALWEEKPDAGQKHWENIMTGDYRTHVVLGTTKSPLTQLWFFK